MKIVNVIGGLGNQMFQYAFALVLKEKFPNEEILIDTQLFRFPIVKKYKNNNFYHHGYEIEEAFPNAPLKNASWWQMAKVSYFLPNYVFNRSLRRILPKRKTEYKQADDYAFYPEVFTMKGDCFFEGYWQHYKYFEGMCDVLSEAFRFPQPNQKNNKITEQMRNSPSIGMHVRRGDYVGNKGFGDVCTLEYYQKAIEQMEITADTHFYVFSNDIAWCKANLEPLMKHVTYVDWNKGKESHWDMYLMSQCEQLVIANSSFSWWGAYLNQRASKIIAPKLWNRYVSDMHIQMPEWQLI